MNEQQQIEALRRELEQHNYNYYVLSSPTITDKEFDDMMHRLQELEAAHPECYDPNSPTQRVGSDLTKEFAQVEHRYPMLSLANTYSEAEVRDWYERVRKGLNESFDVVCELKYDGTSISLWYEQGKLLRAVTRGDGVKGDDVTGIQTNEAPANHFGGDTRIEHLASSLKTGRSSPSFNNKFMSPSQVIM